MARKRTTPQQRLFCYLYVENGGNATQAAKDAGYSSRTAYSQGPRLLENVEVKSLIDNIRSKAEEATGASIEATVGTLEQIRKADPKEMFKEDGSLKHIMDWPEELRLVVAGYEVHEAVDASDEDQVIRTTITKIKFERKTTASDQLMKHLGGYARDNEQKQSSLSDLLAEVHRRRLISK